MEGSVKGDTLTVSSYLMPTKRYCQFDDTPSHADEGRGSVIKLTVSPTARQTPTTHSWTIIRRDGPNHLCLSPNQTHTTFPARNRWAFSPCVPCVSVRFPCVACFHCQPGSNERVDATRSSTMVPRGARRPRLVWPLRISNPGCQTVRASRFSPRSWQASGVGTACAPQLRKTTYFFTEGNCSPRR